MMTSIVIPVYNSAATIGALVESLATGFGAMPLEIVLVNDGSSDDSHAVCRNLCARHPGVVTYVRLARNFGEHNAVMAGLRQTQGDFVVVMDDDFQNPPTEVARLVEEARRGGFDVVYSQYECKRHHWGRNLGSRVHNWMATYLLGKPKELYLSSFKCLSRFVVNEAARYAGPFPYLDGLILRCTRNIGRVTVRHEMRAAGRSGYTLRKLVRVWLNMFLNFSVTPLRLSSLLGLAFSGLGMVLAVAAIIEKFMNPDMPVGWASIMVALMVLSGAQLMVLGLFGEYLGAMFMAHNGTPQYVVREVHTRDQGTDGAATPGAAASPGTAG